MSSLYIHSIKYAIENDEINLYRNSLKENIRCSETISNEINKSYHNNCLNSEKAVDNVVNEFGIERVSYVVAETIKTSLWDGRYSNKNKAWALSIETANDNNSYRYKIKAHPGLVDLFVSCLQKVIRQQQIEDNIHQISTRYPSNPHIIKFEAIEIFGQKALFTDCKLELSNLPKNMFCYELRDDRNGNLVSLEPYIRIDFAGSVITATPIQMNAWNGLVKRICNDDIKHSGQDITLSDFMKESSKRYRPKTNAGYEIIEHHTLNEKTSFVIGYRRSTPDCCPFVVWKKNDRGYDLGFYCNSYDEAKKNQIERIQRARDIESPTFSI